MFQIGKVWGEGFWVRVPVGTIYYIVIKAFSCQKKEQNLDNSKMVFSVFSKTIF